MLKKPKSPESSFIHKSLIEIASFAEYTCLIGIGTHIPVVIQNKMDVFSPSIDSCRKFYDMNEYYL